jgi:chromosomal replication initiator protein
VLSKLSVFESSWLQSAKPVALHDSLLILDVPNTFTRDMVEQKMKGNVEELLGEYFGRPITMAINIDPELENVTFTPDDSSPAEEVDKFTDEPPRLEVVQPNPAQAQLNPRYTFDTFVVGESNRFPHATAIAVAENPGAAFNPLLIYGDSGLGKTHLLHAIGHYIIDYSPQLRVKYVSTEEMMNEFINSVQTTQMAEFRRAYRENVDVLLIDDIQFIERAEQTQDEFFHIFNVLHNAQKQIVITSDRPPQALTKLEPRLRSRFEWGLMADVQPPSIETRTAILRKRVTSDHLEVGNDVLEFIASRVQTNIRELEGALIRVTAYANLQNQPLTLSLAEHVLEDLVTADSQSVVTPELIQQQVADYYGIDLDTLLSKDRTQTIATARQVAMYLSRELTSLSYPIIGNAFGGRDHTTVIHAERKIKKLLSERRDLYDQVTELTNSIRQASRH